MRLLVSELTPGDVVLLAAGDDVPADCRLIEAFGVRVNTANLTGESKPMARNVTAEYEELAAQGTRRTIAQLGYAVARLPVPRGDGSHHSMSVFSPGHRRNRRIWYGIIFELLLMLLIGYTPWGNALFGTAPIGFEVWLFIVPFGFGMLLLEELRKAMARR